jgi:hypothetical protein
MSHPPRLVIGSPHRYGDLARIWYRWVARDVVPAFEAVGLEVEVHIFRDANSEQFTTELFPGVRFWDNGAGMRDHMEYYDAALQSADCDFLLFLDSDTFFFDAEWAARHFAAFADPKVAAVSLMPRNGRPAMFALLCRTASYRALPPPAFACRYEFPDIWPNGKELEVGDYAARELATRGQVIVNISAEEALRNIANFRSSTALRATKESIVHEMGEQGFERCVVEHRAYTVPAFDNVLLGCLYQALFAEPFAASSAGVHLGGSVTVDALRRATRTIQDREELERLRARFGQSERHILRMAERERVQVSIPSVLPDFVGTAPLQKRA